MRVRKLEDRIFLIKPVEQNGTGKYIPYCLYYRHQGIVIHNKHKKCEKRDCHHYLRLYMTYKSL